MDRMLEVIGGTAVSSVATYSNPVTGNNQDPLIVAGQYQVGRQSPVNFLYGVGNAIVRTAVGVYMLVIDTTDFAPPGREVFVTIQWAGADTLNVVGDKVFKVTAPAIPLVLS